MLTVSTPASRCVLGTSCQHDNTDSAINKTEVTDLAVDSWCDLWRARRGRIGQTGRTWTDVTDGQTRRTNGTDVDGRGTWTERTWIDMADVGGRGWSGRTGWT